jgi:hypothetical protein
LGSLLSFLFLLLVGSSLTKPISLSKYLTFLVVGMGNLEMISRHSDDRIRPDAFVVNRGIDKYENQILHLAKRLVKKSWNFVGVYLLVCLVIAIWFNWISTCLLII